MLLKLAWKSLLARRISFVLTSMMIAVSVFVLLSVETLRQQSKQSFSQTVSGVDLIVGARTGQLNLLLYSVFHIGQPSNNISWQSYQQLASAETVDWTIPMSMGDSHRGYRVVGTTAAFFEHFQFADKHALTFNDGKPFDSTFEVAIGASVARQLDYQVGDKITLSHGLARNNIQQHETYPFTISGILAATGTPVDRAVYVSLIGIEAIHQDGNDLASFTAPTWAMSETQNDVSNEPAAITAFMVGLKSRLQTFSFQRQVNDYRQEALLAILPGATLFELWGILGGVEQVLMIISGLVLLGALIGMSNMLLVSMRERRYELAVLRAIGVRPARIFLLLQMEALLMAGVGCIVALGLLQAVAWGLSDTIMAQYGLYLTGNILTLSLMRMLLWVLLATCLVALIPAISAYRQALNSHLNP